MTLDSGAPEHRVGVDAEWDRKLVLEKMKLDHELARYGLRGTLFGTFAALATMVIIFIAQVSTARNVVEGWAFTGMVLGIVFAVVLYGAFIHKSALTLEGKIKDMTFRGETSV
jgi:hypothetical protein